MASNWSTKPLSVLCEPDRGITYGIVKVGEFVPGGVPVIRGGDIRGGRVIFDNEKRVTKKVSDAFSRTILVGGEIVLNLIAEPGHSAIVPSHYRGFNVSRDVAVIPLNGDINHRFVDFVLRSKLAIDWLTARLQGSVTQKINLGTLRDLPVPIPPRREQDRIVHILGSLDDKIELNRRMNETLEAMARRLFRSWFVDFDPVHAKAALRREHPKWTNAELSRRALPNMAPEIAELFPDSFEGSTLGPIPKEWSTQPLYDIARFVNGAAFKDSDFCSPPNGKPVIKIAELKYGITSQTKFSTKDVGSEREISRGDLLYSWSGSPDTSLATFRWTGIDGLLNQHIFKVIAGKRSAEIFAYYQLTDLRDTLVEIARNKQTTGLGHVTVEDMRRLHVMRVNDRVLDAFAMTIGAHFDLSFNLEIDSLSLSEARDRLLPKLISGELSK